MVRNKRIPKDPNVQWGQSPYLPEGWLCQKVNERSKIAIISDTGTKLDSVVDILDFMQRNPTQHTDNDIKKLPMYA